MLRGVTRERNVRSKIRWFADSCDSHHVSHFAAFFILARAKISVVRSCISCMFFFLFFFSLFIRSRMGNNVVLAPATNAKRERERFYVSFFRVCF